MEMHNTDGYNPTEMFNGYYNLRYFLSHEQNTYQLDIGKSYPTLKFAASDWLK